MTETEQIVGYLKLCSISKYLDWDDMNSRLLILEKRSEIRKLMSQGIFCLALDMRDNYYNLGENA